MGRDLTPRELYATEQWNVQNGRHDLWGLMENTVMIYNGTSQKLHSDEEMALRKEFPFLGKLLNKFRGLHAKLSEIDGGVDLLHRKDKELGVYIKTGKGDENSALLKWFNGELDPNFHYSDYNESLLRSSLLLEAQLLCEKISICVYKDTLGGYLDEDDNLTYITVPTKWLVDKLKEEGIDDIYEWYGDYTADDTDNIARLAFFEGVILDCEDKRINIGRNVTSDCVAVVRALNENDCEVVSALDDVSGNNVAWGIDSQEYAWGIFVGSELVGYCTVGGADDAGYEEYEGWTNESLCLSDVFVKEEYRGKGLASRLIDEALKVCNPENKDSVFITVLNDRLVDLYEPLGFKALGNGVMVRDKNKAPSLESQIGNAVQSNNLASKGSVLNKDIER